MTTLLPMPAQAGIGLRHPHYQKILNTQPNIPWFEVHSENYFADGGLPHFYLEQIATQYPLSFHGVGMSLGSAEPLNVQHLHRLKQLVDKYQPLLVSEHLSFSAIAGRHFHDLLPIPYTQESLATFCDKVKLVQDTLGRQLLIENPSSYVQYQNSDIPEWEFYAALPGHTGCGLLLDVNNVFVSCNNHGYAAKDYLNAISADDVKEYHLAGHASKRLPEGTVLIDDHGSIVSQMVWDLFEKTITQFGIKPTLIEWDTNIPALDQLLDEMCKAQHILNQQQLEMLC